MTLSELIKELQEDEALWLWDAKVIISIVTNWDRKIHKEYDTTVVSQDWKFIFLSDFQREWKTKNYWTVVLWE